MERQFNTDSSRTHCSSMVLVRGNADFKPADRKIFLSEWLEFGVTDVPRLFALLQTQSVVIPTEETSTNRLIAPRLTVQRELVEIAACGPAKQNLRHDHRNNNQHFSISHEKNETCC